MICNPNPLYISRRRFCSPCGASNALHLSSLRFVVRKLRGDPLDHEHLAPDLDLPDGVGVEAILIEGDLTRRQRAGKSAEQSAAGSSNQVIEGAGMRLLCVRGDAVVLGDLAVNPEEHRFLLGREMDPPGLPLHLLYLHP